MYTILASAAIMATSALATSIGSAIVVNACEYDVYVCNVPAEGGGYSETDKTLSPNGTFTTQWTELSNLQGWSIKLSRDTTLANIMQYEYTFHNDGLIWYDLSDVNGNPWDGDWEITAESSSSTCTPKQQAYRYATDDAYGMQACPQDSVITVTLCSGESQDDGGAASASSSVAAETSSIAAETSSVAAATSTGATPTSVLSIFSTPSSSAPATSAYPTWHTWHQANAAATTLVTSAATSSVVTTAPNGVTVIDVETSVVTEVVTATQYAKRHVHHPHHVGA